MLEKMQLKLQKLLFDLKMQQAFLEDIASLIEDGAPLNQALEIYVHLGKDNAQALAINMLKQIGQGKQIADAMSGWFPDAVVEIVRAGEEGGILSQSLRAAANSLLQREGAFSTLFNILIYPIIVICMALGVSIFINHTIFDAFRVMMPMESWPANAQLLSHIASFIQHWWSLLLLTAGTGIFLWIKFLSDYIGEMRTYLDKLPIWSSYRKMQAARLMEILGLLMSNGLVMRRALKILQSKASPYLASHLMLMEHRLGSGRDNIADVLDTGLISDSNLARLRLIAQTRGFEEALVRQGQRAAEEGAKAVISTGKIFAGALLAGVALFAIFMITSIYAVGFSIVPV